MRMIKIYRIMGDRFGTSSKYDLVCGIVSGPLNEGPPASIGAAAAAAVTS